MWQFYFIYVFTAVKLVTVAHVLNNRHSVGKIPNNLDLKENPSQDLLTKGFLSCPHLNVDDKDT